MYEYPHFHLNLSSTLTLKFNLGSINNIKIKEFVKMLNIDRKKIFKTKRVKDLNKINFNKAKNLVQLPDIKSEIYKYLKKR